MTAFARASVVPLTVALAVIASWAWIAPMAIDMYGPMTGWSAWMMRGTWDAWHLLLLWAMWAVMMAAMMLPSAAPLVLLYDGLRRQRGASAAASVTPTLALAAGYLLVWALFSVGATILQRLMSRALLLNPMMEMPDARAAAAVLLVAGVYQFTGWKGACLRQCRSPLSFVMQRWRRGTWGALRMGLEHGAYCLGCCWALMLLLFAGGVMNLAIIVALTVMVLVEKLAPFGVAASRAFGAALIGTGVWWLIRG